MMDPIIGKNLQEEKSKKEKTVYGIYSVLFCIISLLIFAVFIKDNKSFIWKPDGAEQHFIILYDFNQILRNIFQNGIPMLSWDMGLGLDIIGQYSYYIIGDPFAYFSLLFPLEKLETAYNLLIILRMYCVGLAFIAYCRYRQKEKRPTIIGAIILFVALRFMQEYDILILRMHLFYYLLI